MFVYFTNNIMTERTRKKLMNQLENMQMMWIPIHRLSHKQIEFMNKDDVQAQVKMHLELWTEFNHKPEKQPTCCECGKETGKAELFCTVETDEGDVDQYYNEVCRDCMEGEWYARY